MSISATPAQIEDARAELRRAAMLHIAGLDLPITGVDIPDSDCLRRLADRKAGIELHIEDYLS